MFNALPKPVSASTMIGSETASATAATVEATSVSVVSPMSGAPKCIFASPAPVMYTAENPRSSTTRANKALGDPGTANASRLETSSFNKVVLLIQMPSVVDVVTDEASEMLLL